MIGWERGASPGRRRTPHLYLLPSSTKAARPTIRSYNELQQRCQRVLRCRLQPSARRDPVDVVHPPLPPPHLHQIAVIGTTGRPFLERTIRGVSASTKRPYTGDAPRFRGDSKFVIPRRSHGIFGKLRWRAYLSGGVGSIRATFCLGPAEGEVGVSS
ncbi:hypothetical protein BC629DRAFT_596302 [Irpex lacteus]|nr:hypothetical protein BC629DRAFT_596302 [Irpex lacteus]